MQRGWTDGSCKSAVYDTPAAADGRVFFGSNDCSLWAVDAATGRHLFNISFGGVIDGASPVEYITREADKNKVRRAAITGLLLQPKTLQEFCSLYRKEIQE